MPKVTRVLGPPGAGKTTFLLNQVEKACDIYFSKQIGVVSFTTAALKVAKDRIINKLGVESKDIPGVRTIHAHAYSLLNIKPKDIMEKGKNIQEFNENYSAFQISGSKNDENMKEFEGNDKIFSQVQLLRSRMAPIDQWPEECSVFFKAWSEHMENEGKIDFLMMLEECIRRELSPVMKILMVDEAQDLNKLEMTLVQQWGEQCDKVFYIGDTNQAIFNWCGADPALFFNLRADEVIPLTQSYRMSPSVLRKSRKIIEEANVKELVELKPTDKYGTGQILNVREPDFSLPGSHMVLFRCNYQVKKYMSVLRKTNTPYGNQYRLEDKSWNPLLTDGAESIKIYLRLLKGESLDIYEIKKMAKSCIAKMCMVRGTKKKIEGLPLTEKKKYEFFGLLAIGFLGSFLEKEMELPDYFKINSECRDLIFFLAINDPGKLFEIPRITVSTIHGVKGGEARHVWIDPSITTKIKRAIQKDPDAWDSECRCAYVACSRAQETIGILPCRGHKNPFLGGQI
jgi:superfamily I DNA/RNA helicase